MLPRYATFIMTIEYKRVHYLVRGLRIPLRMSTQSLVAVSRPYAEIFDHA